MEYFRAKQIANRLLYELGLILAAIFIRNTTAPENNPEHLPVVKD